ncbi:MAG: ABC transporter permease [Phycisphaerae bacterium]
MYKWFLAWRYLHTKLIAIFGVASVTLCVAMVLVVLSVMGGFVDTIKARSRGLHSEIVLDTGSMQGFPYYAEFASYLTEKHPDLVTTVTPTIHTYGILREPQSKRTKPVQILGVRLRDYGAVNDFLKGLHYDRFFPGTTNLAPAGAPVVGLDPGSSSFQFPPPFEEAQKSWLASNPSEKEREMATELELTSPKSSRTLPAQLSFKAKAGPPEYQGPEFPGVIPGCDVINWRRPDGKFDRIYARGAIMSLTVLPLTDQGNLSGTPPVKIPCRYVDDSRTGIYDIDSLCVYVDFDMLQQRLAMNNMELEDGDVSVARTNQLLVGLADGVELNAGRSQVADAWENFKLSLPDNISGSAWDQLQSVRVMTWEDIQRSLIAAVEKEKILVTVLFSLISVVAIVLLGCIFYMIVEKKIRDIGILKSLGASSQGIASMFVIYALAIGIVGSVLGTILGSTFVWNINDIQDALAQLNPNLRVWSAEVYTFDRIPETVKTWDAFWIAVVAVISSMLGSLIPAVIAGRVWPVRTLRYE